MCILNSTYLAFEEDVVYDVVDVGDVVVVDDVVVVGDVGDVVDAARLLVHLGACVACWRLG